MSPLAILGATVQALTIMLAGMAARAGDVQVDVGLVGSDRGTIRVQVCAEATFLKADCAYRAQVKARRGIVRVLIPGVPPGKYAVWAHHDIDSNGDVGQNALGIPIEGIGFSRGGRVLLRQPSFSESAVSIGDTLVTLRITLKFEP